MHQQLRQELFQRRGKIFGAVPLGEAVAHLPRGIGEPSETQFTQVARQRGLVHIPSALPEESPELLLTGDRALRDQVANGGVSL